MNITNEWQISSLDSVLPIGVAHKLPHGTTNVAWVMRVRWGVTNGTSFGDQELLSEV